MILVFRACTKSGEEPDIRQILERLKQDAKKATSQNTEDTSRRYSVAVIAPYAQQVEVLRREILPNARTWTPLQITIATVDSYQGRQVDVVLISTVRTAPGLKRWVDHV